MATQEDLSNFITELISGKDENNKKTEISKEKRIEYVYEIFSVSKDIQRQLFQRFVDEGDVNFVNSLFQKHKNVEKSFFKWVPLKYKKLWYKHVYPTV